MIPLVLTVITHLLQSFEAILINNCQHYNQDYAWGNLEEVVSLGGPSPATLLYGNSHQMYCIAEIDALTMQAHNLEESSSANQTCHLLIEEFKLLLKERHIQAGDMKFILPFGTKLYYFNTKLNAFQFYSINQINAKFNQDFDVGPQINAWINRKLNNYQYEAVIFFKAGKEVPQYPSMIISAAESSHPATFYYHQTEGKTGEGTFRQLGTSQYHLKALYLQNRTYEPQMTALAFFDAYYGQVRFRLDQTKENKEELEIFPVLPVQGILGCPVHLCWWPYLEDIVYHDGIYYLFQGHWMFVFAEGTADFNSLNIEHAIDLHASNIKSVIFAAFYDPFSNLIRLVHYGGKRVQEYIAKGINVTADRSSGYPVFSVKLADEKNLIIDLERGEKVITSVVLNEVLWLTVSKGAQKTIQFYGFIHDNAKGQFRHKLTIGKSPYKSLVAMFYHPGFDHLFIVSGFFLYIFQKPDLNQIEQSFCSVTLFYRFFNCSGYHILNRMNIMEDKPVIASMEKFIKNAEKYHYGEFLPGQCNYKEDLKLTGKIHFESKIQIGPSQKWYESKVVIIGGAIIGGILFTVAVFFVCFSIANRKSNGKRHNSVSRLNKEKKLKQFLKQQFGKGGKFSTTLSSSGNSMKLKSTSASLDTSSRRKRNTTTSIKTATSTGRLTRATKRL